VVLRERAASLRVSRDEGASSHHCESGGNRNERRPAGDGSHGRRIL